jgi:hypothetical protein
MTALNGTKHGDAANDLITIREQVIVNQQQSSAGKPCAEGLRLLKLAGQPTRKEAIFAFDERRPIMTWAQRAAAGVPGEASEVMRPHRP